MLVKIKKFMALTFEEKKLFVEAWFLLGVMRLAILTLSFKRLTRAFEQSQKIKELSLLNEDRLRTAQLIGKAITKAASHTPWESACLAQALTAQKMLQKRGIPGVFYLGAKKDQSKRGDITAHAWSQCGDKVITGGNIDKEFTILSVFSWDGQ